MKAWMSLCVSQSKGWSGIEIVCSPQSAVSDLTNRHDRNNQWESKLEFSLVSHPAEIKSEFDRPLA